jgi:phenylacetate-CoA ligase
LDRDDLERLQVQGLRRTLARIAAENPKYSAHLGHVKPEAIQGVADIQYLPFLTKDILREGYPFGFACGGPADFLRMHMSSGTTGNPIINPYTRSDVEQWREVMARCYAVAGVTREDVIQVTPSFGLFTGGFGFHYGAEALGAMVIPIGAGRTLMQLQLMRDLGATVITAIATYPLRIMEVAKEEGFDLRRTKLRVGIFGSEMWSDQLRRRIEEGMGIRSFDIIGMTETGGPGMGIDCEARQGVHVWEDQYLVEIIEPETGHPLSDGQEGELVVTTLTREGLPLVRYRTRDLTRVVSRDRCECGRTHVRLARFTGRTDDMVIFKGVNFYPQQIERLLLRHEALGHEYQLYLDRDAAAGERLILTVEVKPEFDTQTEGRLRREVYDFLGLSPEFRFVKEGDIPRAAGKAVRVVERRNG